MEPSRFGFNKAISIPRMKPEDSKETKREKEKQRCLEDDAMQEIISIPLMKPEDSKETKREKEKQWSLEDDAMQKTAGTCLSIKVPTLWPHINQILPPEERSIQLSPSFYQLESNQYLGEVSKALGNLTSLNLRILSETLGNLTSLVTLNFSRCDALGELPETLGNLTSLVTLDLSTCDKLEELPKTLGNLTSLVTLNLSRCCKLEELPETLGNLTSLVTLDLSYCRRLKRLPDTLGNLTSVVALNLSRCYKLEELPETLGNLTSLVTLDLSGNKNLEELPETLGNLTSLVTLNLSTCDKLEELPETLGNLTSLVTLDLSGCNNLKELPETLGNLVSLVTLDLSCCRTLKRLPDTLGNFTSVVALNLSRCYKLEELPETLGNLTSLVTLDLSACWRLKRMPETLGNLTSLVTLDLSACWGLKRLPETLGNLTSLDTLNLNRCVELEELPETLGNLTSLVMLNLSGCVELEKLPETLDNLTSLVTLNLSECKNLKELPETLGNLVSLVTLDLSYCWRLKRLPNTLGNLTSLVTLNLSRCDELEELPETLGNLTSLVTLNLSTCIELEELPVTLGNLTSLVTLDLSICWRLKRLPETLGNLTSLVTLDLSGCDILKKLGISDLSYSKNLKGKYSKTSMQVESELIARQESQSGTNYEEASSSLTIERADGDRKIFSHILGEVEDAIDQSQAQAQSNTPSIPFDRKEETSAAEVPNSQEPLNLQRIMCSKGDGVAVNMHNLKSNLEHPDSIETTVAGEMVDDSLRLCFENGEIMSRMVGVGLDYAVVMVSCDYEIVVEEKSEDVWRSIVRGDETTTIERLVARISNHVDCLEGNSSPSLDPIGMAKLIGVGIEGPGNYANREKKPSIPWNAIIELVKIMFWTRFQSHTMSAIIAKSTDAKVQSGVHGAKIWDLEGEKEDDMKDFKVPPSWWSTKWWQNIVVDDIQLSAPFNFNKESSSGKIGRQQSGDANVQRGQNPSSSNEDSKLHHQTFPKINSHGKRKDKDGGDNNDEDDDHNNAKRTCQDGSEVALHMEEDDDISTVCVTVKPKYGCWRPPNADDDQDPANIEPHLKFWFHKNTSSREIKVHISVRFDLGDYGPTGTPGLTFFGWFHDDLDISLRSMECDSSNLNHDNKILEPSTFGKSSWRERSESTSNPARVCAHLPVLNRPFDVKGMLRWEKGWSATHTRESEQICEMMNQQSWGGFIFKANCRAGGRPSLAYKLKHPIQIPNQVWEKSCYDMLVQSGICSTITPAIEGTWVPLNNEEASEYLLEAHRVFQKRCKNNMVSTHNRSSSKTQDDITVKSEQEYKVKLYVNHAMTHMNRYEKSTITQNKPMKGGLIDLEDNFYGMVSCAKST